MIFRKPWLFLIKYFKLIHFIMLLLMTYIILKTNNIYQFFADYTETLKFGYTFNQSNEYISQWFIFIIFILLLLVSFIIMLFKSKKKPWFLYLVIVANYLILMILLLLGYNLFESMEIIIPDIRYVKLMRDVFFASLGVQYMILMFTLTRALGFDLKKFNFTKDISELKVTSQDSEEFEVNFKFDVEKLKQKWNYFRREVKVIIIEQKYMIALIMFIIVVWLGLNLYIDTNINNPIYGINDRVRINSLELNITNVDTTDKDIKGRKLLEDKQLIVVSFSLKNSSDVQNGINVNKISLLLNDVEYRPDLDYYQYLNDFGVGYEKQQINNRLGKNFYVVFKTPKILKKTPVYFRYDKVISNDGNSLYYKIKLDVKPLVPDEDAGRVGLKDELKIKNTALANTKLIIEDYKIAKQFEDEYNICIKDGDCIEEKEMVVAKNDQYQILKLITKVNYSPIVNREIFSYPKDLFNNFATLHFVDENAELKIIPLDVIDIYDNESNNIYINIPSVVSKSDKLLLNFKVRGVNYWYDLKSENT